MKAKLINNITIIIILFICLITAILQAMNFTAFSFNAQISIAIIAILIYLSILIIAKYFNALKTHTADFIIIAGVLLHAWYVLNTGINDRQHDEGNITILTDNLTNGGHLGYIEYFVKNHHMPDFNPFAVYSYYHPPLHHILAALMVSLNLLFKVDYTLAFENVQVLTLLYSAITMIFTKKILTINDDTASDKARNIALALICFHPSLTFISGSVNNDMLTIMLETIAIYYTFMFIQKSDIKNLLSIAFSLGFAIIGKMNAIIFAFPIGLIFLLHFINEIKKHNTVAWIKKYITFGIICCSIGLSFIVRNAIVFHEKPGILSANSDSIQYMGNYSLLTRLGIPLSLDLEYPFHSVYGKASKNVWLIMTKTSVFSEIRPDVAGFGLFLSQIVIILAVVTYLLLTVLLIVNTLNSIKSKRSNEAIFCLSAFTTILLTYIAFVIKYPYTCSCDFRYITISLVFAAIALLNNNKFTKAVSHVVLLFIISSNVFLYLFCI